MERRWRSVPDVVNSPNARQLFVLLVLLAWPSLMRGGAPVERRAVGGCCSPAGVPCGLPGSLARWNACLLECDGTRALTCLSACQKMFGVLCFPASLLVPDNSYRHHRQKAVLSGVNGLIPTTSGCSAQRRGLDYCIVSFFVLLLAGCARHRCPGRKKPARSNL